VSEKQWRGEIKVIENPDLRNSERVVTHAPMKRFNMTKLVVAGAAIFVFHLWTTSENREAVRTRDWDRCWSLPFHGDSCHSEIAANAAARLRY
jgi:hypothetical protein